MIDYPDRLQMHAGLLPNVEIRKIFDFIIPYCTANPIANAISWTTNQLINEADSFDEARQSGAPTLADFERLGTACYIEGFSLEAKNLSVFIKPFNKGQNEQPTETFNLSAGWQISAVCYKLGKVSNEEYHALTQFLAGLLRDLAQNFAPICGTVSRASETYIGPTPPLVDAHIVMACLPTDLVPLNYDDPDAFWSSWDQVEYLGGGLALAERGLNILAETDFKALTARRGLDLVRAAKPGLSTFFMPEPSESEQAMLDALPTYLEPIGYNEAEKSAEFTAFVPEDEHLNARDLTSLLQMLQYGTVSNQKVDLVIITFHNKLAAEKDAAPLHAIGARVQYLDKNGEWLVLTC